MSRKVNEYNNLWPYNLLSPPEYLEFDTLYSYYFDWLLDLTFKIFDFKGLPDTFNETFLKYTLIINGKVCVFKTDDGDLLALNCAYTDTPNVYYIPSKVIVNNPRLTKSYVLTPGIDCIVMYLSETDIYNSSMAGGMYELLRRTATMLADNDISLNVAQKNTRLVNFISADTQNVYNSLVAALGEMYSGKPNIAVKSSLVDQLKSIPLTQNTNNQNIVQLIELQQYILAHFYECIGLSTHDQIKKERLITAEINDNIELARFNIDDIYKMLSEGVAAINALFDTDISVNINPLIMAQFEDPATVPEPEPEPEPEAEAEPEPEPEAEPEAEPETEPEPEPEAEAEPEPEPEINNNIIIQIGGADNDAAADMDGDSGEPDNSEP